MSDFNIVSLGKRPEAEGILLIWSEVFLVSVGRIFFCLAQGISIFSEIVLVFAVCLPHISLVRQVSSLHYPGAQAPPYLQEGEAYLKSLSSLGPQPSLFDVFLGLLGVS